MRTDKRKRPRPTNIKEQDDDEHPRQFNFKSPRSTGRLRHRQNNNLPVILLLLLQFFLMGCFNRPTLVRGLFTPPSLSASSCSFYGLSVHTLSLASSRTLLSLPCTSLIMMGKGDGKKNRPKKHKQPQSPSLSPSSSFMPKPQRVSSDINIPIRRQIAFGKINKQYRDSLNGGSSASFRQTSNGGISSIGGTPKPLQRTKFRKVLDEETIQQKALERQRKGQDPDWDVILNQTAADPLVFVDGYNIIHKWSRLKKHMTRGDSEKARQLLLDDLEQLASLKRWRIECVFDGGGNNRRQTNLGNGALASIGRGKNAFQGAMATSTSSPADTAPSKSVYSHQKKVRVIFTGRGVEADSYIEGRCADAKNVTLGKTTSSLMVATDDVMIKMAAWNAGALCMSADRFVLELRAVKKSMSYRVEAAMAAVNGHSIRPESLWGSNTFIESSYNSSPKKEMIEERPDGTKVYIQRVGRSEFLVEDKREKNRKRLEKELMKIPDRTETDRDDE
jgi:predicted RNA-binding protein with PIN domain